LVGTTHALFRVLAGALVVAGLLSSTLAPGSALAGPARPSLPQIERDFMCPVCGVPLTVAESPQADRERAFIRDLYQRGQSETQIKRAMVGQFGSSVLVLPPHHGFDLSAYLVPLIALAVLLAGLAFLLVRWRRPTGADPPAPVAPLTPGEARRLDEDLARWRG
jgi:cytochrome c-type biogenesis protein CcmH